MQAQQAVFDLLNLVITQRTMAHAGLAALFRPMEVWAFANAAQTKGTAGKGAHLRPCRMSGSGGLQPSAVAGTLAMSE